MQFDVVEVEAALRRFAPRVPRAYHHIVFFREAWQHGSDRALTTEYYFNANSQFEVEQALLPVPWLMPAMHGAQAGVPVPQCTIQRSGEEENSSRRGSSQPGKEADVSVWSPASVISTTYFLPCSLRTSTVFT